jgi:hypothetical protein
MSHLSISTNHGRYAGEHDNTEYVYMAHELPPLVKIAIAINLNAALLLSVTIMIISTVNNFKGIDQIYTLALLLPCFFIGSGAAVCSTALDQVTRALHDSKTAIANKLRRFVDICDYSALSLLLASFAIFGWSFWQVVSTLRSLYFA